MAIRNLKFTFRRLTFNALLVLEPRLLTWYKRIILLAVFLSLFASFGFWVLANPPIQTVDFDINTPPELDTAVLTLPPFSTLGDYANRPIPIDSSRELSLSP